MNIEIIIKIMWEYENKMSEKMWQLDEVNFRAIAGAEVKLKYNPLPKINK